MMTYVKTVPNLGRRYTKVFETKDHMNNWFRFMDRLCDPEINSIWVGWNLERKQYEGTVIYYKKGEPHFIEVTK